MNEKNVKITRRVHDFKGYANLYNVKILNSFNPELQLKDTESAIKNKLKNILTELKGFKFVTTLALKFKKKQKMMIKQNMTLFTHTQKQKQLLMKLTLMMCLNQSILQLYQTYKKF